jgi:hypothetical protein
MYMSKEVDQMTRMTTTLIVIATVGCIGHGKEQKNDFSIEEIYELSSIPKQRSAPAIIKDSGHAGGQYHECDLIQTNETNPDCYDEDGDGIVAKYDCNDTDATMSPRAIDVRCDGIDQNCNGFDECDRDQDGYLDIMDCDDSDSEVGCHCFSWCQ